MIFYYSSILWQAVGFNEDDSLIITVITSIVNIVTTLIAIALDRQVRAQAAAAHRLDRHDRHARRHGGRLRDRRDERARRAGPARPAGPIALVAANLFVFFFGMSWGPVVWVLLGEMFPNRIRAAALSLAAAAQWIANWTISTSFPALKDAGLGLAYGIYAAFAFLSFVFVWLIRPGDEGPHARGDARTGHGSAGSQGAA